MNTFSLIKEAILEKKRFVIVGHISPDGDAIGSALALYHFLAGLGKEVKVGWGEKISLPGQYRFLPGSNQFETVNADLKFSPEEPAEVFIAVDVANEERLGAAKALLSQVKLVINIDHHPDNSLFGHLNLVKAEASSTAEIVYALLKETALPINLNTAICLYVALVTDTGQFQYANTTPAALQMASELVSLGVEPNLISQNLYESHSLARIKLLGRVLSKAVYEPDYKLIYTYIDKEDLQQTGATPGDTERLIDHLRAVEGVDLAMLVKAFEKELKVSLRAKDKFDVSTLAHAFGGGGHKAAAGFIYKGSLNELLKEVKEKLSLKKSLRASDKTDAATS